MKRCSHRATALLCAVVATLASLAATAGAQAQECVNEARRAEQGVTALPDCRAYEMVTPAVKNGSVLADPAHVLAPPIPFAVQAGGNAIHYSTFASGPSPTEFVGIDAEYLARRTAAGWVSEGSLPPQPAPEPALSGDAAVMLSAGLDASVLRSSDSLTPEAPQLVGLENLFVREASHGVRSVSPAPLSASLSEYSPQFVTADYNAAHIVFTSNLPLTANAPSGTDPYEWANGEVSLIGILPSGEVDEEGVSIPAAGDPGRGLHTISADGSKIFFTDKTGALYARENGEATVEVSASQRSISDPAGTQPAKFLQATPSGSKVFFLSAEKLTNDSTAGNGGSDLYEYDFETGSLIDLSVDVNSEDTSGAKVTSLLGVSPDGAYVYFAADGQLLPGKGEDYGSPNVYLYHEGALSFVATVSGGDLYDTGSSDAAKVEVTADGHLLFLSKAPLTGYDNSDAKTRLPDAEAFEYSPATGALHCVSCDPSGAAPTGSAALAAQGATGRYGTPSITSDGGAVFFDSPDALVSQDSNGVSDVYEYENGAIHLLSGGSGPEGATLIGADEEGVNVVFYTRGRLLTEDTDNLQDVYDARIGGGFPAPSTSTCSDEGCQGPLSQPPTLLLPGTSSYSGPGNVKPAKRRKAKARKTKSPHKGRRRKTKKRHGAKKRQRAKRRHRAKRRQRAKNGHKAGTHARKKGRSAGRRHGKAGRRAGGVDRKHAR